MKTRSILWNRAKVLLLNRANDVLGLCEASTGSCVGTVLDPKLAFVAALKANATSVILAHNHTSGNLTASLEHHSLTKSIVAAGRFLYLPVMDQLIIT